MADYIIADDGNGNVETYLLADYQAAYPSALIKTPSANFSFTWNGVITDYIAAQVCPVSSDQFAAMTAAGMPIA